MASGSPKIRVHYAIANYSLPTAHYPLTTALITSVP
jgi:hypothetical protein